MTASLSDVTEVFASSAASVMACTRSSFCWLIYPQATLPTATIAANAIAIGPKAATTAEAPVAAEASAAARPSVADVIPKTDAIPDFMAVNMVPNPEDSSLIAPPQSAVLNVLTALSNCGNTNARFNTVCSIFSPAVKSVFAQMLPRD